METRHCSRETNQSWLINKKPQQHSNHFYEQINAMVYDFSYSYMFVHPIVVIFRGHQSWLATLLVVRAPFALFCSFLLLKFFAKC